LAEEFALTITVTHCAGELPFVRTSHEKTTTLPRIVAQANALRGVSLFLR